jgi:hypothetical protein
MRARLLIVVGLFGVAAGISCSGSSLINGTGTGGSGGAGGSGATGGLASTGGSGGAGGSGGIGGAGGHCDFLHYLSAGCSVAPSCLNGSGGSCATLACGCSGHVISGCGSEFAEPYTYIVPTIFPPPDSGTQIGMACDPNAGPDGSGGSSGRDAASCSQPRYTSPGCTDVQPVCVATDSSVCEDGSLACGCSGHFVAGCAGTFPEPYVYVNPPQAGDAGSGAGYPCGSTTGGTP